MIDGGFQMLYAENGSIAFQRQSSEQRLIFIGYRGLETFPSVSVPIWHSGVAPGARLVDYLSGDTFAIQEGMINLDHPTKGLALILEEQ